MTVHHLRRISLAYAMSWWAFTFPPGAYVAASHSLSHQVGIRIVDHIGFILYWPLVMFWP